ncbi:MAG TPA: hypothetical protein VFI02_12015, partial [Armatimonadota bacterium]|nr:hypothetical protein [Armatimonadota bacterium]
TINLTCVEDDRLSGLAKAIHLYVISRPLDWDYHLEEIFSHFKEGTNQKYAAIKELKQLRYVFLGVEKRANGTFEERTYAWYEVPLPADQGPSFQPLPDNPLSGIGEVALPQIHDQIDDQPLTDIGDVDDNPLPDNPLSGIGEVALPQIHDQNGPEPLTQNPLPGNPLSGFEDAYQEPLILGTTKEPLETPGKPGGCGLCRPADPTAAPPTEHLMRLWHVLWREEFGFCPRTERKKFRGIAGRLLARDGDLEHHRAALSIFLKDKREFYSKAGWTFGVYEQAYDEIMIKLSRIERQKKADPFETPSVEATKRRIAAEKEERRRKLAGEDG